MNAKEQRLLSRYRDGEVSAGERVRVEAWLEQSVEAQRTQADFESIGRMLREVTAPEPGSAEVMRADVERRLRLAAAEQTSPRDQPLFGSRWRWAGAIFALVAVFAAGAWLIGTALLAPPVVSADVEWVDTEVAGASTMVYYDADVNLTVIWLMEQEGLADADSRR